MHESKLPNNNFINLNQNQEVKDRHHQLEIKDLQYQIKELKGQIKETLIEDLNDNNFLKTSKLLLK
jgi:hypothetical protein